MTIKQLTEEAKNTPGLNNRKYLLATSDGQFYPDHDISYVNKIAHANKLEVFEILPLLENKKLKSTNNE